MWEKELKAAIEAGLLAKEKILEIYNMDFDVEIKSDDSPVTLADKKADGIIKKHLSSIFKDYAFCFPVIRSIAIFQIAVF